MTDMDGDGARSRHVHVADEEYGLEEGGDQATKVGRRRQVIGILVSTLVVLAQETMRVLSVNGSGQVLQLGIMIHSLVIGLTLSIARGSEFSASSSCSSSRRLSR